MEIMSNEITVKPVFLPAPTSFEEAYRIAKVLAASDLVPKDYRDKPENCLVAMQWGADIGLPGLQALQNIAVINGRPSIWGDAAKALALNSPFCDDIEERIEGEGDAMVAVCIAKRKGKVATEQRFSVSDAKKAGLWGKQGPWTSYPKRMLQMRARGFALRDAFPDALRGLVLAEEAQDYEPKEMGAADRVETPDPQPRVTALPEYTDADMQKNIPVWRDFIQSGKRTPDQIIAMVSSKYVLSEDQKAVIRDLNLVDAEFVPEGNDDFLAGMEREENANT